jgi:hypothetical protein
MPVQKPDLPETNKKKRRPRQHPSSKKPKRFNQIRLPHANKNVHASKTPQQPGGVRQMPNAPVKHPRRFAPPPPPRHQSIQTNKSHKKERGGQAAPRHIHKNMRLFIDELDPK